MMAANWGSSITHLKFQQAVCVVEKQKKTTSSITTPFSWMPTVPTSETIMRKVIVSRAPLSQCRKKCQNLHSQKTQANQNFKHFHKSCTIDYVKKSCSNASMTVLEKFQNSSTKNKGSMTRLSMIIERGAAANLAFCICLYPCNEYNTLQKIDDFSSAKKISLITA